MERLPDTHMGRLSAGGEALRITGVVPAALRAAIDANIELKEALMRTQMPRRFQAMVLGLTAHRQMKSNERTSSSVRIWAQRTNG